MKYLSWILFVVLSMCMQSYAQTFFTKARADQITVATNGMQYLKFRNLQTDLSLIDSNLTTVRTLTLTPTAISNTISSATAASVQDMIDSIPELTDPSVTALMPTGAVLNVQGLAVSGTATAAVLSVTDNFFVSGGAVERTVASVYVPTNTTTALSGTSWPLISASASAYLTTGYTTNGSLLTVGTSGLYRASFSASHMTSTVATAWIVFTSTSGVPVSNSCPQMTMTRSGVTNSGYSGSFSYPLSAGGTISAFCTYPSTGSVVGGGVLVVTRTPVQDAAGGVITGSLPGGW